MKRIHSKTKFLLLFALASLLVTVSKAAESADVNLPQTGKETSFTFDDHPFVLFLPEDYNDMNTAPVIFYYHGQGGRPNVDFFRHVTGSKGFILIGMSYANEPKVPIKRGAYLNYIRGEVRRLGKLKLHLQRKFKLRINEDKLIISGISKGGWMTNDVFEYRPRPWAGAVIIAAGRLGRGESAPARSFRDKPVYIAAGEFDPNLRAAKRAKNFLHSAGADVSFEMYEGLGHTANVTELLRQWLKNRI